MMVEIPSSQNPFRTVKIEWRSEETEGPSSVETCLGDVLLATVDRLIKMTRLLKRMLAEGAIESEGLNCAVLAEDLGAQEIVVTRCMLAPSVVDQLTQDVIRFPYRLKRIGDMLANILSCLQKKATNNVQFSPTALAELDLLFTGLQEILENLASAFSGSGIPDFASLRAREKLLSESLVSFRLEHWERLWAGDCSPKASAMYLDILDSVKWANEYLKKISETLIDSQAQTSASSGA
jgi:hypothetical protein